MKGVEAMKKLVETIETLRDCCIEALEGSWDRSDDGFEAMLDACEKILPKAKAAPLLLRALKDIANRLAPGSPDIASHDLLDLRETAKRAISAATSK